MRAHRSVTLYGTVSRVTDTSTPSSSMTMRNIKLLVPPVLPPDHLLAFERAGHCTVHGLAPQMQRNLPAIDAAYASQQLAIHRQKLRVLLGDDALIKEERSAADEGALLAALRRRLAALPEGSAPFLQAFNLWRTSAEVAELAASPALAGAAAALLGVDRVRLYQDSLFVKRPGDGQTHWHSDLAMSPLDTNSFVTCWLPLQSVPAETDGGSGLVFASGSHRDVALHYWHGDSSEATDCDDRGYAESEAAALALGDATFHHGWTLHCASPNQLRKPRRALAFSYFADGATRLGKGAKRLPHSEDAESYAAWLRDVPPAAPARHRLLPLVWDGAKGGAQRIAQLPAAERSSPKARARPARARGKSKGRR